MTFLLTLLMVWPLGAQPKPTLQPKDYGRFENLGAARLSPNGRWLAYPASRVNEINELRIRRTERDSTRTTPFGTQPAFSANSRWLAWTIGIPADERRRLEKDKKPVRLGVGLLDLEKETERSFPTNAGFGFDATGKYLAVLGYPPEEPKGKGADLKLVDLAAGTEFTIGNVTEYAWSKAGSLAAFIVSTGADAGNGVQVYDAASGRLQNLDGSGSAYHQLAWRKGGADLAFYRSTDLASKKSTRQALSAWRGLDGPRPTRFELDPAAAGVVDTLEVVEHRKPEWADDGRRIAFGLRPVEPKPSPDSSKVELATMQIWHSTDVQIIPGQKARAAADGRRTLLAVWEPDTRRVVVGSSDLMEDGTVVPGFEAMVERVRGPYPWGTMFGRPYTDVWTTDLTTGRRTRALEKVRYSWESPGGKYLLWFNGKDYWTQDLKTGGRVCLTKGLPAAFADTASDTPTDLLPPHGVAGWMEGDRAVLLNDEYDVWRISPDGTGPIRLTNGLADSTVHRVVQPLSEQKAFSTTAPLYFSLHGEWTEKRGYARLEAGKSLVRLIFEDQLIGSLAKADSAGVFLYRAEARDNSPDYFVAGPDLSQPTQVSRTNPFMADYAWGKTRLVEFQNERGRRLQSVLLYPAGYDSTRRYPMIVYTYEMLSDQAHNFQVPSEQSYYNFTTWTQQGYFVLMPDIVFRARDPGVAVLETLKPAVAKIVSLGLIDPKRVGLIGHSWGGYIAAFVPTRTDLFAASVAGAPLTDFVSFMGQIHWTPGTAELDHWETGQARMEVPYWEDPAAHERNSPVHKVKDMKTPLLLAHGDKDGVVEFFQSTEFYNFARRAGKQVVLLVYEGENHGFVSRPNQVDYHRRILEWFGHYLKGEPAAAWITKGTPLNRLPQEIKRVANP